MTSEAEPRSKAITGVPQAMASIMSEPEWFRPVDRHQQSKSPAQEVGFFRVANLADKLHPVSAEHGTDSLVEIGAIVGVDLGRDLERNAAPARDGDGKIEPLFGRRAAKKRKVSRAHALGREKDCAEDRDEPSRASWRAAAEAAENLKRRPPARKERRRTAVYIREGQACRATW